MIAYSCRSHDFILTALDIIVELLQVQKCCLETVRGQCAVLVCKVADTKSHFVSHVLGTCVLDGSSVKVEETPIKAEIIESSTTQFPIITLGDTYNCTKL